MTSTTGSQPRSAEAKAVRRAAVITHGKPDAIGSALEQLEKVAHQAGVELLLPEDEVEKHGMGEPDRDLATADIAVVLGGDGTMLRALQRFLGTDVPVIGINFGRVGFLASIQPDEFESSLARVFAGDYRVTPLPTLEVVAGDISGSAVNDVVALSSVRGRMVVPRGLELQIRNETPDVGVSVLVDGHLLAEVNGTTPITIRLGERASLLATVPEATFFRRYRETFGS